MLMYVLVEFEHDCILEEVVELVASNPGRIVTRLKQYGMMSQSR